MRTSFESSSVELGLQLAEDGLVLLLDNGVDVVPSFGLLAILLAFSRGY